MLVCVVLFIMVALVFDHLVSLGWVLYSGDVWMQYYPAKFYTYLLMKQGHLPLWTPNLSFGYPFFAEAQAGVLYPLHLALLPFSPTASFTLSVVLRYIIGGLFMFLYVRHLTQNRWAAFLSGLAFSFSGYMIAQVIHENLENALIWLPLTLLFLDKSLCRNNRRALIGAGLCMGISFLAGYFYISLLALTTASVYYVFVHTNARPPEQPKGSRSFLMRLSGGLVLFGCITVGIACVQLLPNYELAQESTRAGGLDYQTSTQVSVPPFHLICFLFPKFFGHPSDPAFYWGMWKGNFHDLVFYIGILPFLLALAALSIRRDRHTLFFGILAILSLGLAMGQFSPLWYIWNYLPVFSMMRNPARFLSLVIFAGAILAGLGLDTLLKNIPQDAGRRSRYARLLLSGTAVIGVLALIAGPLVALARPTVIATGQWFIDRFVYNRSIHQHPKSHYYDMLDQEFDILAAVTRIDHPYVYPSVLLLCVGTAAVLWIVARPKNRGIGPAVIVLAAADLFWFAHDYNFTLPPHVYDQKPAYFNVMEKDAGIFRYSSAPLETSLRNYDPLLFGQMWVQVKSPLQLQRHVQLIETLRPIMNGLASTTVSHPLIDLLNIKYIVTGDSLSGSWAALRLDEGGKVYENLSVMPRAFITPEARILPSPQEALAVLSDPAFDPRKTVLLEKTPVFPSPASPTSVDSDSVRITGYKPDLVEIEVRSQGGFLVLTDTWYPGWKAFVDGVEHPILRANYLFRAVPVASGLHRVEFRYEPLTFRVGALISALTLAAVCLLLFFPRAGLR
ncbi:MAG: YfhO family protein [candidate division Zixibacteria bacterium]|nr:YfhO family protein [candidate division Zixibacteria bacterium]